MTNEAQMNANEETLDDLLDETLDDLADLPETKPFPAGAHNVKVTVRRNTKKAGAYIVEMVHNEVVELSNPNLPEEEHPKPGDKSTVFISTITKDGKKNEFGQGQLKLVLKPLAALVGSNNIAAILEGTKDGVECVVVVGIRKSKDENYDDQQDIKGIEVV